MSFKIRLDDDDVPSTKKGLLEQQSTIKSHTALSLFEYLTLFSKIEMSIVLKVLEEMYPSDNTVNNKIDINGATMVSNILF